MWGDVTSVSQVHVVFVFRVELCRLVRLYIYVSHKLTMLHTSTQKMDTACTSETSETSPTTTRCNNPSTELTSIINHRDSLKSVSSLANYIQLPCMVPSLILKDCRRSITQNDLIYGTWGFITVHRYVRNLKPIPKQLNIVQPLTHYFSNNNFHAEWVYQEQYKRQKLDLIRDHRNTKKTASA